MADRALVRRSPLFAVLPLAAVLVLLSGAQPGPSQLADGESVEFELDFEESRIFSVHLAADSLLHLVVEQNGLDVQIEMSGSSGPRLPPLDLPFGARVPEELLFEALQATDLRITITALEGRGRLRLHARYGPTDEAGRIKAHDFATYWRAFALPPGQRIANWRQVAGQAKDPRLVALAWGNLGLLEIGLRDWAAAVADFDRALQQLEQEPEPALAAHLSILRARAMLKIDRARGLQDYEKGREMALLAGDPAGAALVEQDLGFLAWQENNGGEQVRRYTRTRRLYAAAGFSQSAQQQEINLARSLIRRGQSPEPLARLLRLLADFDHAPANGFTDTQRAEVLREIGWWLYLDGQATEARPFIQASAELAPKNPGTLQRLAIVETGLKYFAAAHATLEKALGTEPNALESAAIEASFSDLELARGDIAAARIHSEKALALLAENEGVGARQAVELLLARCDQLAGRLEAAEARARNSSEAVDRQRLQAGDNREKLDFLAVRTESAELLTELRLELHGAAPGAAWELRALEADEKSRGRLLQDLLSSDVQVENQPIEAERRSKELQQILAIRSRGLLLSLIHQGTLADQEVQALTPLLDEIDRLRAEAPAPRGKTATRVIPFDLAEVQRELEPDTLLLVFHLGPKTSFGWAIGPNHLRGAALGPSQPIRELAHALYGQLAGSAPFGSRALDNWSALLAQKLYDPFAAELENARQVVVVAPSELQQVPFAALPYPADSGQPLLLSRALAVLPSAAILPELRRSTARRSHAPRLLAVVDDPVYDNDPRLPPGDRRDGSFRRLPDTALEGQALVDLASVVGASRITGFEANRERLLSGGLAGFRILHFATHARTDEAPRGLVLSRYDPAGRPIHEIVGFSELASLRLDADLVMTSACSTALGEDIAGEGVLGLSQGFLAAGIPRLVLTLWNVRGEPTRDLVDHFYRRLLAGIPPAEALRQAQSALSREGRDVRDWGAFELHGDWRALPEFAPLPINTRPATVSLTKVEENSSGQRAANTGDPK